MKKKILIHVIKFSFHVKSIFLYFNNNDKIYVIIVIRQKTLLRINFQFFELIYLIVIYSLEIF